MRCDAATSSRCSSFRLQPFFVSNRTPPRSSLHISPLMMIHTLPYVLPHSEYQHVDKSIDFSLVWSFCSSHVILLVLFADILHIRSIRSGGLQNWYHSVFRGERLASLLPSTSCFDCLDEIQSMGGHECTLAHTKVSRCTMWRRAGVLVDIHREPDPSFLFFSVLL